MKGCCPESGIVCSFPGLKTLRDFLSFFMWSSNYLFVFFSLASTGKFRLDGQRNAGIACDNQIISVSVDACLAALAGGAVTTVNSSIAYIINLLLAEKKEEQQLGDLFFFRGVVFLFAFI